VLADSAKDREEHGCTFGGSILNIRFQGGMGCDEGNMKRRGTSKAYEPSAIRNVRTNKLKQLLTNDLDVTNYFFTVSKHDLHWTNSYNSLIRRRSQIRQNTCIFRFRLRIFNHDLNPTSLNTAGKSCSAREHRATVHLAIL